MRSISHSEISALLDCQARHDFAYVGQLAGTALKSKTTAPLLRDGRAWGAAVAAWHANSGLTTQITEAASALTEALQEDAAEQRAAGLYDQDAYAETWQRLNALLHHYIETSDPLPIDRLEHEIEVAIPSRTGRRRSNAYRLLCRFDGVHVDDDGRTWIVEFKLRGQLTPLEQIALSRQTRWYAWAWREHAGVQPAGVIVDERLNEVPKPARVVQGRKKGTFAPSHAKDQLCTVAAYTALCAEYDEPAQPETINALAARRWQQRHQVLFRDGELDEAGRQLVSAAWLANQMDTGHLWPIRNPSRARCPGCAFREICPDPGDTELVDALFHRVPAKHEREEAAVAA
jgi:hypothetical protein